MDELTAVSREDLGVEHPGRYRPMKGLGRLGNVLDRIFMAAGYLSGLLFLLLAVFVTYDVIARKWGFYLHLPTTRVTDEISGYILALAAPWGLAYTLRTDAHVRIDVLLPYLSHRWGHRGLHCASAHGVFCRPRLLENLGPGAGFLRERHQILDASPDAPVDS